MTMRWCANCQHFLGETDPYDRFEISHGLCLTCAKKGLDLSDADLENARRLQNIQRRLWLAGKEESVVSAEELLKEAFAAQVRPIDIVLGFIAPLLHRIGVLWAQCQATVDEEHRYTAFCEKILDLIESQSSTSLNEAGKKLQVLIVNPEGNYHSLGVRILAIWFQSHGITARAIYPSLPTKETMELVQSLNPEMLGISMALREQLPQVLELVGAVQKLPPESQPKILLGGYAVKQGMVPAIPGVALLKDLGSLLEEVAKKGKNSAA